MSANPAALPISKKDEWAALKNSAITELEHRGYEVRGKTTTQIRRILRRPPTLPVAQQTHRVQTRSSTEATYSRLARYPRESNQSEFGQLEG